MVLNRVEEGFYMDRTGERGGMNRHLSCQHSLTAHRAVAGGDMVTTGVSFSLLFL
jgi:hypothetical protein